MQSTTSVAPWQPVSYYSIPNFQIHRLHLSLSRKISSCQALNYQTKTSHDFLNKKEFFFSPATTTSSCNKEHENKKTTDTNSYPRQNHAFVDEFHSSNKSQKTQKFRDNEDVEKRVISTNMWWADLKAAVGQRINLEGLSCAVGVFIKDRHLVVPHVAVPDIRYIDWVELKRRGFQGVVFDKDNTITVPYSLALWRPLRSSVEECKSVFGNNIAVFSNSAGLHEYDPDGRKARALEFRIGIKVIRHRMKKPAGSAKEIERHFGCESSRLVLVGDRPFTDIVYGNQNGFLTILANPLSLSEEPFIVKQLFHIVIEIKHSKRSARLYAYIIFHHEIRQARTFYSLQKFDNSEKTRGCPCYTMVYARVSAYQSQPTSRFMRVCERSASFVSIFVNDE